MLAKERSIVSRSPSYFDSSGLSLDLISSRTTGKYSFTQPSHHSIVSRFTCRRPIEYKGINNIRTVFLQLDHHLQ